MSIDVSALGQILCSIIEGVTGESCIIAQQNAPRPVVIPYSTVNVVSIKSTGWDEVTHTNQALPDTDLDEVIQGMRSMFISINFFRDGAHTTAEKLRTSFQSSGVLESLSASGLGLSTRSETRNLSEEVASNWEKRAQFDVDFYIVDTEAFVIATIEALEVSGEFESSGGETFNVEIEVP